MQEKRRFDVAVVGGGPAGLYAAWASAKRGVSVVVLEEDGEIGVPEHCAGLISISGLRRIELPTNASYVLNKVRGAWFFSPRGAAFRVVSDDAKAVVVDRVAFDKYLAKRAEEAGAEVWLKQRVKSLKLLENSALLKTSEDEVRAKVVIDAEGASRRLLKELRLAPRSSKFVAGLQCEAVGVEVDVDLVELHFGRGIAPGFFAWTIPIGEDSARLGLGCGAPRSTSFLNAFIKKRAPKARVVRKFGGPIITSGPIPKTYFRRLLVVGDAAGQVKPTTGGGVVLGCLCAKVAGEVAVESIERGDFSAEFLSRYEERWRKLLGRELDAMLMLRRVVNSLPDGALDLAFWLIKNFGVDQRLSEVGDIDFQSKAIRALLTGGLLAKQ